MRFVMCSAPWAGPDHPPYTIPGPHEIVHSPRKPVLNELRPVGYYSPKSWTERKRPSVIKIVPKPPTSAPPVSGVVAWLTTAWSLARSLSYMTMIRAQITALNMSPFGFNDRGRPPTTNANQRVLPLFGVPSWVEGWGFHNNNNNTIREWVDGGRHTHFGVMILFSWWCWGCLAVAADGAWWMKCGRRRRQCDVEFLIYSFRSEFMVYFIFN